MELKVGSRVWVQSSGVGYVKEAYDNYVVVNFVEKHAYYAEYDHDGYAVVVSDDGGVGAWIVCEREKYRSLFQNPTECIEYIKLNI